jgi:spore germination protein YaaH
MKTRSMHIPSASSLLLALGMCGFMPHPAFAATSTFEVSGWLPYWRAASSTADVLPHLNKLTEINPFGYTVKNNGTLFDAANLNSATSTYAPLIKAARAQGVRVIPTVMWSNTDAIDTVLSNPTLRKGNVAAIVAMVKQNNFDGVDIDYEGKKASDITYFSDFLQELYVAMGNKFVDCTIEARTPPQDLNTTVSLSQIQYANDFTAINKYCDRVRLMTYDQESVDKTLNAQAGNNIYAPVSDPKWDTAVVQLAEKSIKPSKLELGVATYGYEYNVTPYANKSGWIYDLLWSFGPGYAIQLEKSFGVVAMRDSAGELGFTYTPTTTQAVVPPGTGSATSTNGNQTAAVAQADPNALPGTVRYVTWSDSVAIAQKVALARQLGIRGVVIFKLDGGEDQNMWNVLP